MEEPLASFALPYNVTRQANVGVFTKGIYADGAMPTTVAIRACIQPLSGRALLILPEGERTKETISIWSDTLLLVVDQANGKRGDRITYNGKAYEVSLQIPWLNAPLSHYQYAAAKLEYDN